MFYYEEFPSLKYRIYRQARRHNQEPLAQGQTKPAETLGGDELNRNRLTQALQDEMKQVSFSDEKKQRLAMKLRQAMIQAPPWAYTAPGATTVQEPNRKSTPLRGDRRRARKSPGTERLRSSCLQRCSLLCGDRDVQRPPALSRPEHRCPHDTGRKRYGNGVHNKSRVNS